MTFAQPAVLALAALATLLVAGLYAVERARRRSLLGRIGELPAVRRMMTSASPRRRRVKAVLVTVAMALVVTAAARPQIAADRTVRRTGLDLVIAIDASSSMRVADAGGDLRGTTRLDRARREVDALLDLRGGDRVALVLYAGAAIHFPLTEDYDVLRQLAGDIGPADLPGGSDLGEALRVSRCLLRTDLVDDLGCRGLGGRGRGGEPLPEDAAHRPPTPADEVQELGERGKAILIFTDGGDTGSRAGEEAARARELGIAVFLAGVGTAAGGRVPDIDADNREVGPKRDASGQPVVSKLDAAGLQALATASGDPRRYLDVDWAHPPDGHRYARALRDVARGIRTRSDVARREDVYPWFLFPAFLLLVIEACIGTRRRVRYPEAEAEVDLPAATGAAAPEVKA